MTSSVQNALFGFGAALAVAGCTRSLGLGTDIIWSDDFESGDISAWSANGHTGSGEYLASPNPLDNDINVSSEQAHSGRYSAKVTIRADAPLPNPVQENGGGLYVTGALPQNAYYSAWFYIPHAYTTITNWDILKFQSVPNPDAGPSGGLGELITLSLQSRPSSGPLTIMLSDARHQYLQSPLPDPPPTVPIGQWFQIECLFRNQNDVGGGLVVWLDGVLIYDVDRPMPGRVVYYTVCNIAWDLSPSLAELFIDDVAISWTRITPHGILKAPS